MNDWLVGPTVPCLVSESRGSSFFERSFLAALLVAIVLLGLVDVVRAADESSVSGDVFAVGVADEPLSAMHGGLKIATLEVADSGVGGNDAGLDGLCASTDRVAAGSLNGMAPPYDCPLLAVATQGGSRSAALEGGVMPVGFDRTGDSETASIAAAAMEPIRVDVQAVADGPVGGPSVMPESEPKTLLMLLAGVALMALVAQRRRTWADDI
jgi:hypothetical protein